MSGKRLLSLIVMLLASVLFVGTAHAADATWSAEYWNNTTLSGTPAVTRNESVLSYDWGLGSPAASIDPDTFSARWERDVNFNAGTYRFTTVSDDGIRVYVDGDRIINNWTDHAATVNTADVTLTAGDHEIVVEYYENELQAIVGIDWYELPDDIDDWRGEYFDNEFLAGTPDLIRDDETIDFDWGEGSPSSLIDDDFFSVRWTQTLDLSAGTYRFTVTADDGVRLYVDGDLEIDAWVEQPATTYTETVTHNGGDLDVVLEYFEREGFASVELDIDQVDDDDDPPTGTVIRDIDSPSTVIGGPPSDWNERSTGGAQGNYLWSENYYNIVAGAYNWVRWFPNVSPGDYEVQVYIPAQNSTTTFARYWVHTRSGYTLVVVDQSDFAAQWVSLGTYYFAGQSYEKVSLSDVTYETIGSTSVAFDAVRWIPR